MSNFKIAYQADDDGFYVGEAIADEDSMNPGSFLLPRNASFDAPPPCAPGEVAKLRAGCWTVVPDFFGVVFWLPDRTKHVMQRRGVPLPEGATTTEPELTPEQKLLARKQELQAALAEIDAAGARPAREIALAVAAGDPAPQVAVQRLKALEADAAKLRAELASLS
ncbi:MAG: hypothetical protein ACK4MG_07975 [Aquabacterium sp.]